MTRQNNDLKHDYSDEQTAVMAVRNIVGGSTYEIAEQIKDNPALLVEVSAKMGIPPMMLKAQVRRILKGKPEEVIQEAIDSAASAVEYVRVQDQLAFEGQTSAVRKSLAVSRLESCFTTLYSMGVRQEDWRAIKAAATVAVDIARVDGTLKERDTIESELEKAAKHITERKRSAIGHDTSSGIIEAAIVSQPHGATSAAAGIDDLGGAQVVGGADGF